jgi:choice-of-anchor A domain-containing protein
MAVNLHDNDTGMTPARATSRRPDRDRDAGLTLVELLVTVTMMGVVMTAITAAVIVILRSEDGVVASTAESHDTRQVVSYVPLDVASGPGRANAYRAAIVGTDTTGPNSTNRGTGCDPTGNENVLRIDLDDDFDLDLVDKRIAYRLEATAEQARLDRYTCSSTDGGATWNTDSVVNVADFLDPSGSPVVEAEVVVVNPSDPIDQQQVARVELRYVQRGEVESIIASPREEQPLGNSGLCGSDPLAAARNFSSFVQGDVYLAGPSGTAVKSSLFVGGTLRFTNGSSVAQAVPDVPDLPVAGRKVGLVAGAIDWGGSTGTLDVKAASGGNGHDLLIEDGVYHWNTGPGSTTVTADDTGAGPRIGLSNGAQAIPPAADPIVSAGAAFAELRACSDRLAGLPDTCDNGNCAAFVGPPPGYVDLASSTPQLRLNLSDTDGVANVLNLHEDDLADIDSIQIAFAPGEAPDADNPFVINIKNDPDDRDVVFEVPALQGAGANSEVLIWNFPNAENVTILAGDQMWGTIMAPYAKVTSYVDIDGSVIARQFDMFGSAIHDERSFQGTLQW